MSIDIQRERVVVLTKAPRHFITRPNMRTVWRWAHSGVKGAKLETLLIGGRRITSIEAIDRFLQAINQDDRGAELPALRRSREHDIQQAKRELDAAGI